MPEDNQEQGEKAKFNLGLASLQRIDQILYKLEEAIMFGDLSMAKRCLLAVYDEIDCFLKDDEREEVNVLEKQIELIFSSIPNIDEVVTINRTTGDSLVRYRFIEARAKVTPLLIKLNRVFRKYMKAKGLLMPPESESSMF